MFGLFFFALMRKMEQRTGDNALTLGLKMKPSLWLRFERELLKLECSINSLLQEKGGGLGKAIGRFPSFVDETLYFFLKYKRK